MGVLAIADALRGSGEEETAPPPPRPTVEAPQPSPGLVQRLRAEGPAGTLLLVDDGCRLLDVTLPELKATERPGALCAVGPRPVQRAPARLTDDDLRRAGVADPRVAAAVELSPGRDALLLAWPGGGWVLAFYEGRELAASHRFDAEGEARIDAAPGGSLVAVPPARIFRRDGTPVRLAPRFRNARAVAWSPDGRWTALAMRGATVLVPTQGLVGGAEARRAIRLPFPARDVAWTG